MARREYDYIKGNTALAPERKRRIVRQPNRKYKQIQRRKKLNNKNTLLKNIRKNDRKYLITIAGAVIVLGFLTISGDGKVYNMEKSLSSINTQISATEEANEALKVKIIKASSLNGIEKNAQSKLAMFVPSKKDTVKVDFSENYFKDLKPKSSENNTKENSLFSKLINLIK